MESVGGKIPKIYARRKGFLIEIDDIARSQIDETIHWLIAPKTQKIHISHTQSVIHLSTAVHFRTTVKNNVV
jgi:hypothetical protein